MLVNKVLGEGIALISKIKSDPELLEIVAQQTERNAKLIGPEMDYFGSSLKTIDINKRGLVKLKKFIISAPEAVMAKITEAMEKLAPELSNKGKDPSTIFGDLSIVHKPRTEIKRALRNNPEAQSFLKKLIETLKDSDVKKTLDSINNRNHAV